MTQQRVRFVIVGRAIDVLGIAHDAAEPVSHPTDPDSDSDDDVIARDIHAEKVKPPIEL